MASLEQCLSSPCSPTRRHLPFSSFPQSSLAALQRLHAASQNQLFALQSASEEQAAGAQGELEMATAELERAQVAGLMVVYRVFPVLSGYCA